MRTLLVTAALAATTALAVPALVLAPQALAQGAPQTVQLMKVDVLKVSTGYRASKVIGSSIVNEAGDTVGKVDDIIVGPDGKAPFVVLSVGGFLGIGDRLIALPYEQMKTDGKKIVLPGATKDSLKALPEFKYAS
jgi:sporulation protein YlmC with PRC-barrel domain